jgi:hypothetical protein
MGRDNAVNEAPNECVWRYQLHVIRRNRRGSVLHSVATSHCVRLWPQERKSTAWPRRRRLLLLLLLLPWYAKSLHDHLANYGLICNLAAARVSSGRRIASWKIVDLFAVPLQLTIIDKSADVTHVCKPFYRRVRQWTVITWSHWTFKPSEFVRYSLTTVNKFFDYFLFWHTI